MRPNNPDLDVPERRVSRDVIAEDLPPLHPTSAIEVAPAHPPCAVTHADFVAVLCVLMLAVAAWIATDGFRKP